MENEDEIAMKLKYLKWNNEDEIAMKLKRDSNLSYCFYFRSRRDSPLQEPRMPKLPLAWRRERLILEMWLEVLRVARVIDTLLCILARMWHLLALVAIFWTYVWTNCTYINTWTFIYLCLWIPLILYMYMCMIVNVYKDNSKKTYILYSITMLNNLTNCQITMLNNLNITYQFAICGHIFFYLWSCPYIEFRLW